MGKLSIVTEESSELRINVADRKIYYNTPGGTVTIIEGSLKYRPLHCSELSKRLESRNWNKSETLFIQGDSSVDNPILRYKKSRPTGEIDTIDTLDLSGNLSFPLCGTLDSSVKAQIDAAYSEIFDSSLTASEEMCFLESTKNVMDTSKCQESIDIIKGSDSYTSGLSLRELIEYSSYPGISARLDMSIKYSVLGSNLEDPTIYTYFTTIDAFRYDNDRNLILEDTVENIGDDLIRLEYFGGVVKLFPISPQISECIINDCTIIYGNFR